jgi:AcrR family transcriptional regulator
MIRASARSKNLVRPGPDSPPLEKFDRKLGEILQAAAQVFSEDGYDRSAIRSVAERAGVSVPGLYYYVSSKEELLYLLQYHAFRSLVERYQAESPGLTDPAARLELLIRIHFERFLPNIAELNVCSRELDRLKGEYLARIQALQHQYFALAVRLFADLGEQHGRLNVDARAAALAMFGSINWVYTWYRPGVDPPAGVLAANLLTLYLHGVLPSRAEGSRDTATRRSGNHAALDRVDV